MRKNLYEEFDIAVRALGMSKDELMKLAFNGDTTGIDFALPLSWTIANPQNWPFFYYASDCRENFAEVKNMRELISDEDAEKIILQGFLKKVVVSCITSWTDSPVLDMTVRDFYMTVMRKK